MTVIFMFKNNGKDGFLYMDDYGMKVQATVDLPSVKKVDEQIRVLEKNISKLKISGHFDESVLKNLTNQLNTLKANIKTAAFSSTALNELTTQVENALSSINISGTNIGKEITKNIKDNIDTGIVSQINKISDSSTSTIVQNEKKKQEAYKATSDAVVYHAGVISKLNKAETNGRFYGSSRGTGYFGTGHYFVDSKTKHELDNNSSYSKLPYTSVDISKYDNLFKATTDEIAGKLHSFLENLTRFTQGSDSFNIDELFSQFKNVFTDTTMDIKDFGDKMEQLKSFMSNSNLSDRSDSVSTQFMKSLGYGGVDTRGTKYADTRYGTVIYDLKEESILQANITDELQKQGQMLEKINYEKGQVFDSSVDAKIQEQIDTQRRLAEVQAEFKKSFNTSNLDKSDSELTAARNRLSEINDIISNCQHSIENATAESQEFAREMKSLGLNMTDREIEEHAKKSTVNYQNRIEELSLERAELEKRIPVLEENYNKESQLASEAYKQAQQVVEQRRLEAQQSSTTANEVIQNEKKKQQAIQDTTKVQEQLVKNGNIIQQTDFATSFNTKGEAEKYFNVLSKTVSVQEKLGENKNLESFIVEVKNAEGVVEKLTYKYNELTGAFEYSGGSVNDNGVVRQMNMISAKADNLQTKLDKLKANYSDINSARPIKDSNNISALSEQYNKVSQAIENVRNSDNVTFSSMVSNAQNEISVLESMISQFRNAENVATQMKSVDISSGIAQAQERLGKLKANASGFEQMTQTIYELDVAIENVGDKSSLDKFLNDLRVAETQLGRVKAEAKQLSQVHEIQLSMDGKNTKSKNYDYQIDTEIKKLKDLGFTDEEVTQKVKILTDAQAELKRVIDSSDFDSVASKNQAIIESDKERTIALNQVRTAYGQLKNDASQYYNLNKQAKLSTDIQNWLSKNSRASKEAKESLNAYYRELSNGRVSVDRLNYIEKELKDIDATQRGLGKLGKNLKDQFSEAGRSFTQWLSVSSGIMALVYQLQKIPKEVIAVNSAMVELRKVSDASDSEITKYFDEAAESAKKYGSAVSDMINATADWSRLGYNLPDSKKLAEVATLYTNVGDGIDMNTANEHLISTLQGFQLEAEDALGIIDRFNEVANNFPIDTAGIGEALQRSAASFYAANTDLSKSIALITGTNSVVQDPDSVGTMWKTVSMRLRGVTQELEAAGLETEGMVESTVQLRDLIQGLTGFDIMADEAGTQFKDIYDIVVGIGHEWKNLTDVEQAGLLEALAGKRQGNALSAALNNISMIEEAYKTAEDSAGSALKEQEAYEQGIEYSLDRLEASFQTFANHILDSNFLKGIVDFGNSTINVIDTVTSKLGSLGTIGLGAGLFAGLKNVGMA